MPIKYIPYVPNTIEGQAILNNITRTRRVLRYRDNDQVYDRIQRGLPLYEVDKGETIGEASENLLIRGECLSACAYLKDKGIEADLVYIDPPFASGADYAKRVYLRPNPNKARELAGRYAEIQTGIENGEGIDLELLQAFEEKMYGDIWNKESYLNWMYENLVGIKAIMSSTATIYVHLDWNIGHYVKILMDEIFGEDNFINEIIWHYENKPQFGFVKHLPRNFDTIFVYAKEFGKHIINHQLVPVKKVQEQAIVAWDPVLKKRVAKRDDEGNIIYESRTEKYMGSVWEIPRVHPKGSERVDYNTQKPKKLLENILKVSSSEETVVVDFFGGSGTAAKVAHSLGKTFIHVDVGINSIQTTRDELKQDGASFTVLDVKDGVSLFRNPVQTMDKLKTLIHGLKKETSLDQFWAGGVQDSKLGMVPVFLPDLKAGTFRVLDTPFMNRVLREALPDLPDGVKQAVIYYIDIDDRKALDKFIKEQNPTDIKIELRDLKQVLDQIVLNDDIKYEQRKTTAGHEIEIVRFVSDRLQQKIDEYNQKRGLNDKATLFEENGEENEDTEGEDKATKKGRFKPLEISPDGLELIELVSLDCTASDGEWHADSEVKIDKHGFLTRDNKKTREFWDAKIHSRKKPLRMKVRNIAGDESILKL